MYILFSAVRLFLFAYLLISLGGCSSTRTTHSDKSAHSAEAAATSPEQLLAAAFSSRSPERKAYLLLQATGIYWQNGLSGQATATFLSIAPQDLNIEDFGTWIETGLAIGINTGDSTLLSQVLKHPMLETFLQRQPIERQQRLLFLLSDAYLAQGDSLAAAISLAEYAHLFPEEELPALNDMIWSAFSLVETSELSRFSYPGDNPQVPAWLDLATNLRLMQSNLDDQYRFLADWQENNAWHSAAKYPPFELEVLARLPDISPANITLALPFSGPLANVADAIRDGFLASYYQSSTSSAPSLRMFDTQTRNLEELYQPAEETPQLIIGPLERSRLKQLTEFDTLGIPTLALNRTNELSSSQTQLFQFSLSAEDEAAQVARHLGKKGLTRVAIIAPDDDFGYRMSRHFSSTLAEAGGHTIAQSFYQDQASLSVKVAELLATDKSKFRARKLRSITGFSLESEPRRRQDLDAIFMIAKPAIARQLNPLFAFHYAKDLPVYTTSQAFSKDQPNDDLNGVRFVEMPWMLSKTNNIKTELERVNGAKADDYSRFYALGADAHILSRRLPLLRQLPDSQVNGNSGILSLNSDSTITRQLQWATFRNGQAIAIQE